MSSATSGCVAVILLPFMFLGPSMVTHFSATVNDGNPVAQCPDCEVDYPNKGLPPMEIQYSTGCFIEFDFSVSTAGKCIDHPVCLPDPSNGCVFKVKTTCREATPALPCCPIAGAWLVGVSTQWDLWPCSDSLHTLAAPVNCGTSPYFFTLGAAAPGCVYNPNGLTGPHKFQCKSCP